MKLTFPLPQTESERPRAVTAVQQKVRKYLKRERRKRFPEGFDCWEFDCRFGVGEAVPSVVAADAIVPAIEAAAAGGATQVFVEILARASLRPPRPDRPSVEAAPSGTAAE